MIINAPTGLYNSILPVAPNDPGNITFTISNNLPPRSGTTFVRLPFSEEFKLTPKRVYTRLEKRQFYSSLIFSTITPGPSQFGSGSSQFEIGEVLDFVDSSDQEADAYELKDIVLQQNTKVPNYEVAGISIEDYNKIVKASESKIEELTSSIKEVSTNVKDNASKITFNQSSINQSNSLLDNTVAVLGEDNSIAVKIKNNIISLESERDLLLKNRSMLLDELDSLRAELQKVREAVR